MTSVLTSPERAAIIFLNRAPQTDCSVHPESCLSPLGILTDEVVAVKDSHVERALQGRLGSSRSVQAASPKTDLLRERAAPSPEEKKIFLLLIKCWKGDEQCCFCDSASGSGLLFEGLLLGYRRSAPRGI